MHPWLARATDYTIAAIERLEESEAKFVPLLLSSRAGGPVAVKAPSGKSQGLVPQTQHFLVYIDLLDADEAIAELRTALALPHRYPHDAEIQDDARRVLRRLGEQP